MTTNKRADAPTTSVRIRANLAVLQMRRGDEATVERTPLIDGLIEGGKVSVIEDTELPEPATTPANLNTEEPTKSKTGSE